MSYAASTEEEERVRERERESERERKGGELHQSSYAGLICLDRTAVLLLSLQCLQVVGARTPSLFSTAHFLYYVVLAKRSPYG
jgi:hypothetical protein